MSMQTITDQIRHDTGEIDLVAIEAEARRLRAEAFHQFGQDLARALRRAWLRLTSGGVGGKPAHG